MEQSSLDDLIKNVKEEMFSSSLDLHSFLSPSAYDTAWLAIIPHPQDQLDHLPLFPQCLDWILNNQNKDGFWGESDNGGFPTLDSLSTTLACMIALKMWGVGTKNIIKGLEFVHANAKKLLVDQYDRFPRWFAIVFPTMVEHAHTAGLKVVFPEDLMDVLEDIYKERQTILETEELVDEYHYPPLISYLEALPPSYDINQEEIVRNLSEDGSLFNSPSATAKAFLATRNERCKAYLEFVVQRCGHGVPSVYPLDEDFIKLCMVNQLEKMGLADHFLEEIDNTLQDVYRNYMNQKLHVKGKNINPIQICKDSIAFRVLRMHGYQVSPWRFCWFLCHEGIQDHIEGNCEVFVGAMLNVYRATDVMFTGETELEEARAFSRKLLYRAISMKSTNNVLFLSSSQGMIKHELRLPWLARLDHLEHRMSIEENETSGLWMGKASFYRLSCLHNERLLQLAAKNYTYRQSIYVVELEELKSWSIDSGLGNMGFGREKTTYCYFAIAASWLSCSSDIRLILAKSAILIIVADDFFDMEGSLDELNILTKAVRRWEGKGLNKHSRIIFDALDNIVRYTAKIYHDQHGHDIKRNLQDMWYEVFESWLMEAKWSKSDETPSIDEYLKTSMISVAIHAVVLPALCLLCPSLPPNMMTRSEYKTITKLLMVSSRLLNDIQSYEKEQEDGKMNLVHLYLKEYPNADIQDSIANVREILQKKKTELLEHILRDELSEMPKSWKQVHLSALKVFQMFYNSSNGFDSQTKFLHDIDKAFYHPLKIQVPVLPNNDQIPQYKAKIRIHSFHRRGQKSVAKNVVSLSRFSGLYGGPKLVLPKFTLNIV